MSIESARPGRAGATLCFRRRFEIVLLVVVSLRPLVCLLFAWRRLPLGCHQKDFVSVRPPVCADNTLLRLVANEDDIHLQLAPPLHYTRLPRRCLSLSLSRLIRWPVFVSNRDQVGGPEVGHAVDFAIRKRNQIRRPSISFRIHLAGPALTQHVSHPMSNSVAPLERKRSCRFGAIFTFKRLHLSSLTFQRLFYYGFIFPSHFWDAFQVLRFLVSLLNIVFFCFFLFLLQCWFHLFVAFSDCVTVCSKKLCCRVFLAKLVFMF